MVVAIGCALWLVFVWLGIAFVTVPLTLLAFAAGLAYGAGLASAGYLRVYWGTEDERALAGPDAEASRGTYAPYPRWDDGWPNYLSRQVERDVLAASAWPRRQAHQLLADGLDWIWAYRSMLLAMLPLAPAPFGFLAGVMAGAYCGWALLAAAIESMLAIPRAARLAAIFALRGVDMSLRWWHGAAVTCPRCRFTVALPAFRCDGAGTGTDCTVIHHDLRPGRLGVWVRRCGCGAQLPTMILRAARTLSPACINCDRPLQSAAGITPDARIIISGGPTVGKTRLLTQAMAAMPAWEPADDQTAAWLSSDPAAGTSALMLRRVVNERLYYLHIVDLDGRLFQTDKDNSVLWQLGSTRRHLLVVDATAIPRARDRINPAVEGGRSWTDTSVATAELPYRLLVRQLSRMGARTRRCSLALVITRADVLSAYGLTAGPDEAEGMKAWLRTIELHGLLAAAEHDFGGVRCFVIGEGWATPAEPFDWLLSLYPHGTSRP